MRHVYFFNANAFNLDKTEVLTFEKKLLFPNNKMLDLFKLKACQVCRQHIKIIRMMISLFDRVEKLLLFLLDFKIVVCKLIQFGRENAGNQCF